MIGIDFKLLLTAFDIVDKDDNGVLDRNDFIQMIFKLLHPPETQDVLLILRKLGKLGEYLGLNLAISESEFNMPSILDEELDTTFGASDNSELKNDTNASVTPSLNPSVSMKPGSPARVTRLKRLASFGQRGQRGSTFTGKDAFTVIGEQLENIEKLIKASHFKQGIEEKEFGVSSRESFAASKTMEKDLTAVNDRVSALENKLDTLLTTNHVAVAPTPRELKDALRRKGSGEVGRSHGDNMQDMDDMRKI